MTPTYMDGDELTRPTHAGAVKKYFVKIYKKSIKSKKSTKKLDKSQTWKGHLGKNERLGGLKTQKGGPGKN